MWLTAAYFTQTHMQHTHLTVLWYALCQSFPFCYLTLVFEARCQISSVSNCFFGRVWLTLVFWLQSQRRNPVFSESCHTSCAARLVPSVMECRGSFLWGCSLQIDFEFLIPSRVRCLIPLVNLVFKWPSKVAFFFPSCTHITWNAEFQLAGAEPAPRINKAMETALDADSLCKSLGKQAGL